MHSWYSSAAPRERFEAAVENEALVVVLQGEVREEQVAHGVGKALLEVARESLVREVPKAAPDPVLQRLRVVSRSEHVDVVVRFDENRVAASKARRHLLRHVADVGDVAERELPPPEAEPDGVRGVVGGG